MSDKGYYKPRVEQCYEDRATGCDFVARIEGLANITECADACATVGRRCNTAEFLVEGGSVPAGSHWSNPKPKENLCILARCLTCTEKDCQGRKDTMTVQTRLPDVDLPAGTLELVLPTGECLAVLQSPPDWEDTAGRRSGLRMMQHFPRVDTDGHVLNQLWQKREYMLLLGFVPASTGKCAPVEKRGNDLVLVGFQPSGAAADAPESKLPLCINVDTLLAMPCHYGRTWPHTDGRAPSERDGYVSPMEVSQTGDAISVC